MDDTPDISVICSTFNREPYLRQTLEAMSKLDRSGLNVRFIVVNNNSSDGTEAVVRSFMDRMPLDYLFEGRPGKSFALNKILDEMPLGNTVVFTDDDVVPCREWLQVIAESRRRWPKAAVFGGKIDLIWPEDVRIPKWAKEDMNIRGFGFSEYSHGLEPMHYPEQIVPPGGNFWIAKEVLADGRRFDESRGPLPGEIFKMGEDTAFLRQLKSDKVGDVMYVPDAVIGHHVQPLLLTEDEIVKRAYRYGLSVSHRGDVPRKELLERNPSVWIVRRRVSIVLGELKYAWACATLGENRRVPKKVAANFWRAMNTETLNRGRTALRQKG